MTYDFSTLSPEDFELLVADLLSKEFGSLLETFKPGKDQGIDLRHSRLLQGQERTVIQCKRYSLRDFPGLHRAIRRELPKIERAKPARYIVATSVELSPHNKDSLLETLRPWCKGPGDIYGATEINALIRKSPEVERAHFKLWIANTAVLEKVIHSRVFNVTEATIAATQAHLSRLVVHDGMQRALSVLAAHHHVLIVGNPGIGKTTLARMLLCHYLMEGFEPIVVVGDIGDAWAVIQDRAGSGRKFAVLYDDFLGQLSFDSQRFGKNEELSLGEFFKKVERSNNLRFILTTREYILADAQRVHGAFHTQAQHLARCTISLDDYTATHRAKVLFNHLYFSDLPAERLRKLVQRRAYRDIIRHSHFSPRIVEGISNYANSRAMSDDEYFTYIEREFDDPSGVWDHPFRHEISPTARELLILLWSFAGRTDVQELKQAHRHLHSACAITDLSQTWTDALRSLDGNFLITRRYPVRFGRGRFVVVVEFQNPSVREYVTRFAGTETAWIERLPVACVNFAQTVQLLAEAEQIEKETSRRLPATFWTELSAAAQRLEDMPAAHLANYANHNGATTQEWNDHEHPDRASRSARRLQIASHLGQHSAETTALQRRLLTEDEWKLLLARVANDDSVSAAVERLAQWVLENSGWPDDTKRAIGDAFRAHLRAVLLDDENIWPISVGALRDLASTVVRFAKHLNADEKAAFTSAAKLAVDTVLANEEDAERLSAEAFAIAELGTLCGSSFSMEQEQLEERAANRSEPGSSTPDTSPESRRYADDTDLVIDVDAMFADLIDRQIVG